MNIYEELENIQSWKEEYTDVLGKSYNPKQFEYLIKKSDVIKLIRKRDKEVIEQIEKEAKENSFFDGETFLIPTNTFLDFIKKLLVGE